MQGLLHPKWKEEKIMNKWIKKPQKCTRLSNVLASFSKPETSRFLTQLDTGIIEVLRGNTLRLYRAKHLPLMNWTYGDTGFYIGWTSYLNMNILIFAKDEGMQFI